MRSAESGELENCKEAATTTTEESLVTAPETYLCIFFVNVVVSFASSVPQTKTKKENNRQRERERERERRETENRGKNSTQETNKQTSMFDEKRRRWKRSCKTTPPPEESSIALSKTWALQQVRRASVSCTSEIGNHGE
jgi:Ni/Co efflux regulator RcnB